jgi:predicted dehydrogenase
MGFGHASHRALIGGFLDAVRDGTPSVPSGFDALKAHLLIDALLRSSASGMPQAVGL